MYSASRGVVAFLALAVLPSKTAMGAAWWYEQAERLQHVSAALLDGPPIAEPVPNRNFIGARLSASLLPKTNPTVGSKQEKVPAAPLHTVPTFVAGMQVFSSGRYSLVGTASAGYLYLPESVGKLLGVKATLSQFAMGANAENMFRLANMILTTSFGFQYSKVNLEGGITAEEAKDVFDAATTLVHLTQGIKGQTIPLWANAMFLVRRNTSKFNISLEKTEFVREDKMEDAQPPIATQITIGANLGKSMQLALSEYIVPDRLIMPRVSFVYQYALGATGSPVEDTPVTPPKTAPRKKKKRSAAATETGGATGTVDTSIAKPAARPAGKASAKPAAKPKAPDASESPADGGFTSPPASDPATGAPVP
jgi:hypothetical protein